MSQQNPGQSDMIQDNAPSDAQPSNAKLIMRIAVPVLLLIVIAMGALAYCKEPADPRTLRELIVQSRDAYHEPWTGVEEAGVALATPEAALEFVSTRIATSFYEGRLQTPEAVLETRTANPADKAMLLQALLASLDIPTQAIAAPLQGDLRAQVIAAPAPQDMAWPEPMVALMDRIEYDPEQQPIDQLSDDVAAMALFDDAEETVAAALERASQNLDLAGQSSAQPVYLDWVWLVGEDGTIYDPILPDASRSDIARNYSEEVVQTQIAVSARDRFGRTQEVVRWSGNAYGTDVGFTFFPTINTLERLIGDPNLSDVSVWTPGIVVGGELTSHAAVTLDGDVVPANVVSSLTTDETGEGDIAGFDAPDLASLSIANVDASTFTRIAVGLNAAVQSTPNWHGAHFRLMVEGVDGELTRVPVRIEEPFSNATHVITVSDQSGSMRRDDRFAMALEFGQTLVGGLSVDQRLAMISLNNRIWVDRLFDPITNVDFVTDPALWQRSVGGQTSILDAVDYALNAVEIELGAQSEERTSIVFISDGEPATTVTQEMRDGITERIERANELNVAFYPVILSASDALDFASMAQETGGQMLRLSDPTQVEQAAAALARRLSGGMVVSFEAPNDPVPDAGTVVSFTLEVVGHDEVLPSQYTVPDDIVASEPGIFVEISSGGQTSIRPLVGLGERYSLNAMTGGYQLYLAPGLYPSDRMVAQRLDRWLLEHDLAVEDEVAVNEALADPAFSHAHTSTLNALGNTMLSSVPQGQRLLHPMAVISRTIVETPLDETSEDAAQIEIATTVDVPGWSSFLSEQASREDVARMGLALNDAEARLLGNGINLTASFVEDAPELSDESDAIVLASADMDDRHWQHDPQTGALLGFLNSDDLPAKGSRDVAIAQQFRDINTAIDWYLYAVQPGTAALPTSSVLSGFVGFKKAELRLWCYSTIMLNYVNESIAGDPEAILDQSVPAAEARARELCGLRGNPEDIGREMFQDAAYDMTKAIVDGIRSQLPAGLGGPSDLAGEVSRRMGGDRVTNWISDPTTRQYAEQVTTSARNHYFGDADRYINRPFDNLMNGLRNHGFGGSLSPTTSGFNAAMQGAIGTLN